MNKQDIINDIVNLRELNEEQINNISSWSDDEKMDLIKKILEVIQFLMNSF